MTPTDSMTDSNVVPARLLAALGASESSLCRRDADTWIVAVDDVARRYRDAIKAGATPRRAPEAKREGRGFCAEIATGSGGVRIILEQH